MIRVLIAENQHMVRGALAALLSLEPDMVVVSEVDRGHLLEPAAREQRPDIALLDIEMPGLDGLSAAGRLAVTTPECQGPDPDRPGPAQPHDAGPGAADHRIPCRKMPRLSS